MKTWVLPVNGTMYRVVLEKDTLDIWVNGTKVSFMPRQMLFFPCVQIPPRWKNILGIGSFLYAPCSFLLIFNKFWGSSAVK
jgi:hypothetical protein